MIPESAEPSPKPSADIFLSYNRADTEAVAALRTLIRARGLGTFFDRDQLVAGLPWPEALEQALRKAGAVAVFIGPAGLGLWQKREMAFALDRQAAAEREGRAFAVVPVLLPGAEPTSGFLFLNTWIDFRHDPADPDGLDALVKAVRGEAAPPPQDTAGTLCPYRGLQAFDEESAAFFFGRENFSRRIADAILSRNLVAVFGPSGTGKSSIIQAGVLPLLRRRRPPESTWDAIRFVPGDRPFQALAAALMPLLEPEANEAELFAESQKLAELLAGGTLRLREVVDRVLAKSGGTDRLLVVADQFEELFTLTPEPVRQSFLDLLPRALDRSAVSVVLSMRGAFYDSLIGANRALSDRLERATVNLGPMTREELREAIVEPARRLGLGFEPGLPKRILVDVGEEPGNLPLLEFALTELWARREGKRLTHAAYEQIGGVAGAIVQRAEKIFLGFSDAEQAAAKRVLVRLIWTGSTVDIARDARHRARLGELDPEAAEAARQLADARLLVIGHDGTAGEQTVEVAHEALIRGWTRLREWLYEDGEFLLWRRRLKAALELRDSASGDESALFQGNALREAEGWLRRREDVLGPEEAEFIRRSVEADRRARLALARQRRRRKRWTVSFVALLLVLTTVAVVRTLQAFSEEMAAHARAQLNSNPEQSVLLGIEAVSLSGYEGLVDTLRLALLNSLQRAAREAPDFVHGIGFSGGNDGGPLRVAALGADEQAYGWTWDGGTLEPSPFPGNLVGPRGLAGPVSALALAPDGKTIALAGKDNAVRMLDARTGRVLWQSGTEGGKVVDLRFSTADRGRFLVTAQEDGAARLWDSATGLLLKTLKGHGVRVTSAGFSPKGNYLVTTSMDKKAILWDARTGARRFELGAHTASVRQAGFSLDETYLVTAGDDNRAAVWEVRTGRHLAWLEGHRDSLVAASFSPIDKHLIVTASMDRTVRVWKLIRGEPNMVWSSVSDLKGHSDALTDAVFTPDGRSVVTASRDGTLRVWKPVTEHGEHALFGHLGALKSVAWSRDGRWLISASGDSTARLWDIAGGTNGAVLEGHTNSLNTAAFSPDGRLAVTAGNDNTARLWEVPSGKPGPVLLGHDEFVNMAAFDPSGKLVVTASDDKTARIWDAATGRCLRVLDGLAGPIQGTPLPASRKGGVPEGANARARGNAGEAVPNTVSGADIDFSPDGALAASVVDSNAVLVRKIPSNEDVMTLRGHTDRVTGVLFSPGGDLLATTSRDGTARLWDARTWTRRAELRGHAGPITGSQYSGDGLRFVTFGDDGTARVWSTVTGQPMGTPLAHEAPVARAEFTADGDTLITTTVDHRVRLWDMQEGRSGGGHTGRVNRAAFSPDGTLVVTASQDASARVWEVASGRMISLLERHRGPVVGALFSPDGQSILTASEDGDARLWTRRGQRFEWRHTLHGHAEGLTAAVFSPGGRLVATASADFTARIWDALTGDRLHVLEGHRDRVNSVEFSPRFGPANDLLVTASRDGTARVWSVASGEQKFQLVGHSASVNAAGFSPDGRTIATASRDGTSRVWNVSPWPGDSSPCEVCSDIERICRLAHARSGRELTPQEKKQFHVPRVSMLFAWRCPE